MKSPGDGIQSIIFPQRLRVALGLSYSRPVPILLLLAGCSSVPTAPKEVRIPIPVSCIERPPTKPSMLSDAELLALDDYGLVIALARDRRIRQGYEAELESAIEACTGAGS